MTYPLLIVSPSNTASAWSREKHRTLPFPSTTVCCHPLVPRTMMPLVIVICSDRTYVPLDTITVSPSIVRLTALLIVASAWLQSAPSFVSLPPGATW